MPNNLEALEARVARLLELHASVPRYFVAEEEHVRLRTKFASESVLLINDLLAELKVPTFWVCDACSAILQVSQSNGTPIGCLDCGAIMRQQTWKELAAWERERRQKAEAERDELQARLDAVSAKCQEEKKDAAVVIERNMHNEVADYDEGIYAMACEVLQILAANPAPPEEPTDD